MQIEDLKCHTKYSMLNSYSSSLFSSFQFSHSVVSDSLWPMDCRMPGLPVHHQLQEFTQTHVHRVSDAIQPSHPCRPLLFLPSVFLSIRVFSNQLALHIRWPKYYSFSFNSTHSPNTKSFTYPTDKVKISRLHLIGETWVTWQSLSQSLCWEEKYTY